jgi:hypothetical protein
LDLLWGQVATVTEQATRQAESAQLVDDLMARLLQSYRDYAQLAEAYEDLRRAAGRP